MAVKYGIKSKEERKSDTRWLVIKIALLAVYVIFVILLIGHFSAVSWGEHRLEDDGTRLMIAFTDVFTNPTNFRMTDDDWMYVFLFAVAPVALYFLAKKIQSYYKHDDPDTVNGDAHFMTLPELKRHNYKYTDPLGKQDCSGHRNMIIAGDLLLMMDNEKTKKNFNVLVIGGSGAGKSRYFAAPNILQYNCNFLITDPSGELLEQYGKSLEDNGYNVKVFNIVDVFKGNRYNPLHYIRSEKDVYILTDTLFANTTNPGKGGGEQFWDDCAKILLNALILYLWHECRDENDKTFSNVMKLLNMASVDENNPDAESPLDILFADLEKKDGENNLAVQEYHSLKQAAGKTMKSVLISLSSRLRSFKLSDIQYLTDQDDFHFEDFADSKQALFVIIPTADDTFNFLASLMYSQLFITLFNYVENDTKFGWQVTLGNGEAIKVFQAQNDSESAIAQHKAEQFVAAVQNGTFTYHDNEKKLFKLYIKNKESEKLFSELKAKEREIKNTSNDIKAEQDEAARQALTKKRNDLKDNRHEILRKMDEYIVGWRGTDALYKEFLKNVAGLKPEKCKKMKCPHHVRFILDEFANIGQIPKFDKRLSTIRKYEISCSVILQSLAQLKNIYKDEYTTIISNCDTILYLGTNDPDTNKWFSEMLGEKTTKTLSRSKNGDKGGSISIGLSKAPLMPVNRLRLMPSEDCIAMIRQEVPYYGAKYDLLNHPQFKYAASVSGTFKIPVNCSADMYKNLPYWKRQEIRKNEISRVGNDGMGEARKGQNGELFNSKISEAKETAKEGKEKAAAEQAAAQAEEVKTREEDDADNRRKARESKVAKEALEEMAAEKEKQLEEDATDTTTRNLMTAYGIDLNDDIESIKEKIESVFVLENPPTESLYYTEV